MQRDPRDLSGAIDLAPPQMGPITAAPPAPMIRRLDQNAMFRGVVRDGIGYPTREDLMDATELIDEIIGGCRQMIREELAAFLRDMVEGPEETAPENVVSIDKGEPIKVRIPRTGPREA